ncbi:MAG TPA: hypothetical protein VMT18_13475 [Planctomycetota bacterium]|nr:hypothetical protein [Planctomycetota bacterium]
MRLLLGLCLLTVVALAAWFLLREEPRGRGDAISRAAPVAPVAEAPANGEGPRDVADEAAASPDPAREEPARASVAAAAPASATPPRLSHVRGLLRSESGGWTDLSGALAGGVVVELVDPAEPGFSRRAQLEAVEERDGSTAIAFRFEGLPQGTYKLGVSSLVPEVWEPREQTVATPDAEVVVWCRDRIDRVRLSFAARDAESGEAIDAFEVMSLRQSVSQAEGVLMHAGDLHREAFPIDGRLDWSLYAEGYAPAFGDERSFEPDGAGAWVARADLRRGWGARVVVLARDPSMRPIEGALVEADGVFVGLTGPRGWLDVARPAAPERISVRWGELARSVDAPRPPDSNEARRRGQMLPVVLQ